MSQLRAVIRGCLLEVPLSDMPETLEARIRDALSQQFTVAINEAAAGPVDSALLLRLWSRIFPDAEPKAQPVPTRLEGRNLSFEFECDSILSPSLGSCARLEVQVEVGEDTDHLLTCIRNTDAGNRFIAWSALSATDQERLASRIDVIVAQLQREGRL